MRIAIVSDIHGNLPALEAVVADIRRRGADIIVNLGDSLSGPLMPRETAHYLMAANWPTLAGNHERQILTEPIASQCESDASASRVLGEAELAWLRAQPATLQLGGDVFLCHGTPQSDVEALCETVTPAGARIANDDELRARLTGRAEALIACGHSHVPRLRQHATQCVLNPGSVGLQAFRATLPYPFYVETTSPDACYAIAQKHGSVWQASLHTVRYDFEPMARLADAGGRPEWAHALRTGRAL
ncbi:metallophosphatase family protein [Niveibacterium sp. 24ML]|uniref:metallophosphoesterase family protein n=1 Tax=Niveibacterium sp. 24ML TaxID=2985512 RepID=UPI00226FB564|nr:metallophosphoesterase family protein [Niveibacterium sp. 24ML]MCX9154805.1 metallophosphatase family protein [Niveibacterium sp. 24ML]